MKDQNIQSVFNKQSTDKFRLVLAMPEALRKMDMHDFSVTQKNLLNSDSLQFSLYSANIPEISVPSKDIAFQGQTLRVTSQTRQPYEPVTCKFNIDNRFRNYWVLWKWLEVLNSPLNSGMADSVSETYSTPKLGILPKATTLWNYQTMITLSPLDEYDKSMCTFVFTNAFITKLSRLDFNYQTQEEMPGDFTFAFGQMNLMLEE